MSSFDPNDIFWCYFSIACWITRPLAHWPIGSEATPSLSCWFTACVFGCVAVYQVLAEWGCPDEEIESYIERFDEDGDGAFAFEEVRTCVRVDGLLGACVSRVVRGREGAAVKFS